MVSCPTITGIPSRGFRHVIMKWFCERFTRTEPVKNAAPLLLPAKTRFPVRCWYREWW